MITLPGRAGKYRAVCFRSPPTSAAQNWLPPALRTAVSTSISGKPARPCYYYMWEKQNRKAA
nr:MAG TPA: hypothetical protein [Caudoviricetes sp.]